MVPSSFQGAPGDKVDEQNGPKDDEEDEENGPNDEDLSPCRQEVNGKVRTAKNTNLSEFS